MPKFELINPYVVGELKTTFNVSTKEKAAEQAWVNLSKYMTNSVPKFAFTLQGENGKIHHYKVDEKVSRDKQVKFNIKEMSLKLSSKEQAAFLEKVGEIKASASGKLSGGKHHHKSDSSDDDDKTKTKDDSSSSDSSDSEEIYKKIRQLKDRNQPLKYMWYSPLIYSKDGHLESIYMPSYMNVLYPLHFELSLLNYGYTFYSS